MRTFTAWEPLEDRHFYSELDAIRSITTRHGHSPAELREMAGRPDGLLALEADAMVVAEKVASFDPDEWLCRICGGSSRTCECEA